MSTDAHLGADTRTALDDCIRADAGTGIDLGVIGWIAIILGALAIILSLVMSRSRRPAGYTTSRTSDGPEGRRYEETRVDPDDRI